MITVYLEKEKIITELAEVQALITKLSAILSSEKLLLDVIKDELREVKSLFADPRRTDIQGEASDLSDEDLARVKERCAAEEDLCLLGLRFTNDRNVPPERFQRLLLHRGQVLPQRFVERFGGCRVGLAA